MNIYIKTFNRPFYLDRCIRTIKFNAKNYDRIIILEDGTLSKYLVKIQDRHPDIEIRKSNADDHKFELLKQNKFKEIASKYMEPAQFWFNEISKEAGNYFYLLEDDTWLVRMLDLRNIEEILEKNNCALLHTWWAPNAGNVKPFKRYLLPDGNFLEIYLPDISDINSLYKIWIICMAVIRKDYFLNNLKGLRRMGDEHTQLLNAYSFMQQNKDVAFARSLSKIAYQGWATPGRATPEYYDLGLRFHLYMECLNEAWYRDELDVTEGYPFDFSYEYILSFLEKALPSQSLDAWKLWRAKEVVFNYD